MVMRNSNLSSYIILSYLILFSKLIRTFHFITIYRLIKDFYEYIHMKLDDSNKEFSL